MKKHISLNLLLMANILFISLLFTSCDKKSVKNSSKKTVIVSTFVLFDIAKYISKDTFELVKIIPNGVDIHTYEPSPKMMAKLEMSDLLIYSGAGLEPWLSSFNFKARAVGIGDFIKLRTLDKKSDEHSHHNHQCSHSAIDPHFWLDIENMKRATDIITYEFITLEPKNKELYLKNRDDYFTMLINLDKLYKKRLASCDLDMIITNHNAFSYLSSRYNFHVKSLLGLSPDNESSPKDIIRIINDVNNFNAPVVFYENFQSDKAMKSLATQTNVKIDSLHTLGNVTKDEANKNVSYNDIMLENLEKISEALVCH